MKKSEKTGKGKREKIMLVLGIWLVLGIITCIFIVLTSQEENKTIQQTEVAVKVDKAESSQSALPAFKKDSGLSEAEKLRNPLIFHHVGNVRVLTNMMGERLGVAQVIKLSSADFSAVTAKNLKDFWAECNFEGWLFVYILENESNENTGRGMIINPNGTSARYGYLNADEASGVEFGKIYEPVREFFYLSDENDFQYYNSDDPDDEGLKRFKDSDRVFAAKIN